MPSPAFHDSTDTPSAEHPVKIIVLATAIQQWQLQFHCAQKRFQN